MDVRLSCCVGGSPMVDYCVVWLDLPWWIIVLCGWISHGGLSCCVGGSPMVDYRVVWVDLPWWIIVLCG